MDSDCIEIKEEALDDTDLDEFEFETIYLPDVKVENDTFGEDEIVDIECPYCILEGNENVKFGNKAAANKHFKLVHNFGEPVPEKPSYNDVVKQEAPGRNRVNPDIKVEPVEGYDYLEFEKYKKKPRIFNSRDEDVKIVMFECPYCNRLTSPNSEQFNKSFDSVQAVNNHLQFYHMRSFKDLQAPLMPTSSVKVKGAAKTPKLLPKRAVIIKPFTTITRQKPKFQPIKNMGKSLVKVNTGKGDFTFKSFRRQEVVEIDDDSDSELQKSNSITCTSDPEITPCGVKLRALLINKPLILKKIKKADIRNPIFHQRLKQRELVYNGLILETVND